MRNELSRRNFLAVSGAVLGGPRLTLSRQITSAPQNPVSDGAGKNGTDLFTEKKYSNWLWIELIGFDNEQPDFGVGSIIQRAGFIPAGVSLLLFWTAFVIDHKGLGQEKKLSPSEASYGGHPYSPERKRQEWTNWQLKNLIAELHKHNIKVYLSYFNYYAHGSEYFKDKEYLMEMYRRGGCGALSMLKKQKNGVWFEDVLQEKTVTALVDYGFDGIQIADGVSSPRIALQEGDYSPEMLEQFFEYLGTEQPDTKEIAEYIWSEKRLEWIRFHTQRWNRFYEKFIERLKCADKEAIFNSAWTRDPFEAMYRYGVDYRKTARSGLISFMAEDVSSGLSILSARDNGYLMTDEERRRLHYEFLTALMLCRAAMPNLRITPLSGVHDTMEQWGVLEHMPTLLTRQTFANLNTFIASKNGLKPITDGPYFCLSDSLSKNDWSVIKRNWILGDVKNPVTSAGVILIWSDSRLDRELEEFCKNRRTPTHKIVSELLYAGAPVNTVARIENIPYLNGNLLVSNFDLLPQEEQQLVRSYKNGKVLVVGSVAPNGFKPLVTETASFGAMNLCIRENGVQGVTVKNKQEYGFDPKLSMEEVNCLWTKTLRFAPFSDEFYQACADAIIKVTNAPAIKAEGVNEHGIRHRYCKYICVYTGTDTCRIILVNDDYYYNIPQVDMKRRIAEIKCITKYDGYEVLFSGSTFSCRVPGKGAEILEIRLAAGK